MDDDVLELGEEEEDSDDDRRLLIRNLFKNKQLKKSLIIKP